MWCSSIKRGWSADAFVGVRESLPYGVATGPSLADVESPVALGGVVGTRAIGLPFSRERVFGWSVQARLRTVGSCDAGRDLGVLGPLVTVLGEPRRRDDQDGAVGVVEDGVRDAAKQQRLHATVATRTQNDQLGVHITSHSEDRGRDALVPLRDPRVRDETSGSSRCAPSPAVWSAAFSIVASAPPSPSSPPNPKPSEP